MTLYYTSATPNFWNLPRKRVEASCSGKVWLPGHLHTSIPCCHSPGAVGQHSPSPLPCPLPSTRAGSRRLHNSEGKIFIQNCTEIKVFYKDSVQVSKVSMHVPVRIIVFVSWSFQSENFWMKNGNLIIWKQVQWAKP